MVQIYIINYKQGEKALDPYTKIYPCTLPPVIDPSLLPPILYVLFIGNSKSTKFIIYFDPKNHLIQRTFHCYIDEYDNKLHPEESIYIDALIIQEYIYGVYQPGTPSPDPKIRLVQHSLNI